MPKGKCIFKKALLKSNKSSSWVKSGRTVYSVYASVSLMLHRNVSLQSEVMNVESAKKSMAPPFFWKTPVHSDASSSSASGTCEKLATPSPSSQPEQLSQGQR